MILAFHGEPSLKSAVMDRLREHRRLDTIAQKVYFENGRGCHLGCITHVNNKAHETAERLFGIEQRIGYWLEAIFEGLPPKKCAAWVLESTEAIPIGADLSKCHHHFAVWLLGDSGLLTITDVNRDAIAQVRELHVAAVNGVPWDESAARSAESAAAWSAESAAWSAESAAESAARSARSAARSAESAAWSAARSARSAARSAESAAESAAFEKIAAKSIEIFRSAPVPGGQQPIEPCVKSELCARRLWCPDGELVVV